MRITAMPRNAASRARRGGRRRRPAHPRHRTPRARRIDNQLRGRAGRQGDPGSSRFYLSLEDDLMRIFASEWVSPAAAAAGMEEGVPIESGMIIQPDRNSAKRC